MGDETLFWYAPWPEPGSDSVRLARWFREVGASPQAALSDSSRSTIILR